VLRVLKKAIERNDIRLEARNTRSANGAAGEISTCGVPSCSIGGLWVRSGAELRASRSRMQESSNAKTE
jgi:hypothetical protein